MSPSASFLADRLPRNRYVLLDAQHRAWEEDRRRYADELAAWVNGGYRLQSGRQ